MQIASLLTRSESWHVCVRAAGGTSAGAACTARRASATPGTSSTASSVRHADRGAAAQRATECPKTLALATTEVPILIVEGKPRRAVLLHPRRPAGLPWWVPIIAFATMFGALVGVRAVARHRLRGWWSGLAVMRETGPRTKVIAWSRWESASRSPATGLLLQAVGVNASVFDATARDHRGRVPRTLPLGPSTGAGGMVLILGAGGVAAVAAAGVLLTATGAVGALAYATWALCDRLWIARHRIRDASSIAAARAPRTPRPRHAGPPGRDSRPCAAV